MFQNVLVKGRRTKEREKEMMSICETMTDELENTGALQHSNRMDISKLLNLANDVTF